MAVLEATTTRIVEEAIARATAGLQAQLDAERRAVEILWNDRDREREARVKAQRRAAGFASAAARLRRRPSTLGRPQP